MKSLCTIVISAMITISFCFAGEKINQEIETEAGKELIVSLKEVGGALEIEGWDRSAVKIEGEIGGAGWYEDCELWIRETRDGIRIAPSCSDNDGWITAHLKIMVPRQYSLTINTATTTHIRDLQGRLELKAGNANVEIEQFTGEVDFSSANGTATIRNSHLDGMVSNVNGNLELIDSNVRGQVKTVNSSMNLHTADAGLRVSSVNGRISIGSVKRFFEATTTNGSIEIAELDGQLQAETLNGHVIANMVGDVQAGDHDVELETMNGDIELYLPDDFPMSVDIEIRKDYDGRNRHHYKNNYRIVSDFDINVEEKERHGEVEVSGSGTVGSGKNRVRIRAVNGDVYLKKSR